MRVLEVGGGPDLGQKTLSTDDGGKLGPQHLDRDLAAVAQVVGQIHGGHAALPQLAVDPVAVGQTCREAVERRAGHFSPPSISSTETSLRCSSMA